MNTTKTRWARRVAETNWHRLFISLAVLVVAFSGQTPMGSAQEEAFYEGKTIRMVPYLAPGSGTDLQSRFIARYLPKYIPGHPKVIIQNMPGGGGVIAANYMYNVARPDGLTIGALSNGMPILSVAGLPGIKYDASKFRWLGSPMEHTTVCIVRSAAGFETIKDVIGAKKPLILGATGRGAASFQVPAALNATLNTNIKIIPGYAGASAMHLAIEEGEIDGRCTYYFGARSNAFLKEGLASGKLRIVTQLPKRHAALPDVPVANELTDKPEEQALMKLMASPFFHWVVPPGTPEARVAVLRQGFMRTFADPDYQKEAKKIGLEGGGVSGEQVEGRVAEMINVSPKTIEAVKKILGS